jgi:hypothetical protein
MSETCVLCFTYLKLHEEIDLLLQVPVPHIHVDMCVHMCTRVYTLYMYMYMYMCSNDWNWKVVTSNFKLSKLLVLSFSIHLKL